MENLEPKEKYKLEYADVGHLRRHYSTVRSGLSTFSITASMAAFSSSLSQKGDAWYLLFVGYLLLGIGILACIAFSYRTEKANLYLAAVWNWFGAEDQPPPGPFVHFKPSRESLAREMLHDEMNWAMTICVIIVAVASCYSR